LLEISHEIEGAKSNPQGRSGFVGSAFRERFLGLLPRTLLRLLFHMVAGNHQLVHKLSGSIFVTSVSPFTNVPGFVIPYIGGPKAVSFAFGSIVKKPVVRRGQIEIREIASVTAIFNHDLIDGAPAARFINELRSLFESRYREIE